MNIILANPRGFCAGVDRAIEITNRALDIFGAPIYVKHEIVHNKYVVDELKEKGVVFIEDINKIPEHSILIYSAHGVSEQIIEQSEKRNLQVFNATCPLVTKVHMEVARLSKKRINTILIGHKGHPEVEGTIGRYVSKLDSKIVLVENEDDVANLKFNPMIMKSLMLLKQHFQLMILLQLLMLLKLNITMLLSQQEGIFAMLPLIGKMLSKNLLKNVM
jgi:4-hydroxy-3-methylbut-2-enyl diphosphate reductase